MRAKILFTNFVNTRANCLLVAKMSVYLTVVVSSVLISRPDNSHDIFIYTFFYLSLSNFNNINKTNYYFYLIR